LHEFIICKYYNIFAQGKNCEADFALEARPYFNVTSGRKRCSKGTPIIKKSNPSLFIKGGTTTEGKEKLKS
jgi:hypothetical protein